MSNAAPRLGGPFGRDWTQEGHRRASARVSLIEGEKREQVEERHVRQQQQRPRPHRRLRPRARYPRRRHGRSRDRRLQEHGGPERVRHRRRLRETAQSVWPRHLGQDHHSQRVRVSSISILATAAEYKGISTKNEPDA